MFKIFNIERKVINAITLHFIDKVTGFLLLFFLCYLVWILSIWDDDWFLSFFPSHKLYRSYLGKIAFNRSCQLVSGAKCRSLLLFSFSSSSFRKIVWHVVTFHDTFLLFSLLFDFHDVCKIISRNFFLENYSRTNTNLRKCFKYFSLIISNYVY